MPTRAVLFDLDDTLVPEERPDQEALLAACERARERYGIPVEDLARAVDTRSKALWSTNPVFARSREVGIGPLEGLWGRFEASDRVLGALRDWVPPYRREVWRSALLQHGVSDGAFSTEVGRAFQAERRARITAFSDAGAALAQLADHGYRLALVTNGAPLIQREKLDGSGLARFFEFVMASGDIGIGKPDPRIFLPPLDALKVRPEEAVMVGNRLDSDVQGARNAGIRSVLIRRPGLSSGDGPSPEFEISSLDELAVLLG